jgi:predicted ester cyclase
MIVIGTESMYAKGAYSMSLEENKAIVRRFFEGFNEAAFDTWDDICAADMVTHQSPGRDNIGLESRKQIDSANRVSFPDLNLAVQDVIAEGDKVVVRFVPSGTQQGEWAGIPPTGKSVSSMGMGIYRLAEGKIVEEWLNVDFISFWRQLDILPPWEELVERAKSKQE